MKTPFKITVLATTAVMASIPALSAPAQQPASSPFLGRWRLDTASTVAPAEARPASVTAEFADAGAGSWNTIYVVTAKDGSARRMTSREQLDGTAVPIAGDQAEYDSVAMSSPSPGVLVMGLSKSGKLASVRVYTLSPSGREMTESATVLEVGGIPAIHRFRWVR